MLTVGMWDLAEGRRPPAVLIPRVLRRVGLDVMVLLGAFDDSVDSLGRHGGYRHRTRVAAESASGLTGAVLTRQPATPLESLPGIARVALTCGAESFTLGVATLDSLDSVVGAASVSSAVQITAGPLVLAGRLGHDLANPSPVWAGARGNTVDLLEAAGVPGRAGRQCGFLSWGVQARGGAILNAPAETGGDLLWVRLAL